MKKEFWSPPIMGYQYLLKYNPLYGCYFYREQIDTKTYFVLTYDDEWCLQIYYNDNKISVYNSISCETSSTNPNDLRDGLIKSHNYNEKDLKNIIRANKDFKNRFIKFIGNNS